MTLKFGTSGLRGLVSELRGPPAFTYTAAFVRLLQGRGSLKAGSKVYVGRDLRTSSPEIAKLVHAAIAEAGLMPVDCGALPTPALALYAYGENAPAIMVTGSHIPDDRNGLKFYRADGEIDKRDEGDIVEIQAGIKDTVPSLPPVEPARLGTEPSRRYAERFLGFFEKGSLSGLRVGVYQHSSVARDIIVDILRGLGAETIPLGRAEHFIPVDTEALRREDVALLKAWAAAERFDAIVSTDGDGDRPLVADNSGIFVRGDLVGAITAHFLGADCVVTPVSSNSALERCGYFARVLRTRVGSPYVIEGIGTALAEGARCVVGFEANGGVLLGSAVEKDGRTLPALLTRDSLLPILCALSAIASTGRPLAEIAAGFRFLVGASGRLEGVPTENSASFLGRLAADAPYADRIFAVLGGVANIDNHDGVRITARNGEVVHFRASGNAPELRCYVEAKAETRADELLGWGLALGRTQILES
ncbi:phosphomannomutase [Mesorhizobium sp.]|uniref:phosphomannomutase n=1 Tax=Mesorhizobium sp. TaxID=1871066 RepID=UPI000FC9DFD1|nr:phosphomannomutase [Mesorhizobium sp.]RUW29914.1 phosphomannomutase [Mesorhizobium sp. M1E.F.Ca.ET.041.01.1.1]RUW80540.1 phosphomannomutase [Mesorhizobium sp. M1E.F.Ca.ET.063.01.1.1]RWD89839.1 MAG: phosphomannomutase [Mesorhizobium sp.]RWD95916.1 MAG: phosphomannomutase [Mesorhizobium sp.]TIV55856.1 MAG: phosphomannomutase [Mesorhizobium sp.]